MGRRPYRPRGRGVFGGSVPCSGGSRSGSLSPLVGEHSGQGPCTASAFSPIMDLDHVVRPKISSRILSKSQSFCSASDNFHTSSISTSLLSASSRVCSNAY
jgi:hypothetical protein